MFPTDRKGMEMSCYEDTRELTAGEKRSIKALVKSMCANYDHEYGCLPLEGTCYMFTIGFVGSGLCRYFRDAVLPLDPGLEAVFARKPTKPCKVCGKRFPVSGRKAVCSDACAAAARKSATAARVRKHRASRRSDVTQPDS